MTQKLEICHILVFTNHGLPLDNGRIIIPWFLVDKFFYTSNKSSVFIVNDST